MSLTSSARSAAIETVIWICQLVSILLLLSRGDIALSEPIFKASTISQVRIRPLTLGLCRLVGELGLSCVFEKLAEHHHSTGMPGSMNFFARCCHYQPNPAKILINELVRRRRTLSSRRAPTVTWEES
jgi:hypothetical protein